MSAGRPEAALASLQRVARLNRRPMPSGKLIEAARSGTGDKARGQLAHMFVPELRRTTLLLWLIWAVCAFCYYGKCGSWEYREIKD